MLLISLACVCVVLTADFSNVMALWVASDCESWLEIQLNVFLFLSCLGTGKQPTKIGAAVLLQERGNVRTWMPCWHRVSDVDTVFWKRHESPFTQPLY